MLMNLTIGTGFVLVMMLLARTEISWINGIIPLFPTFALIGQASTYVERGSTAARDVALVGLPSLVAYAVYLLTITLLSERIGFPKAAAVGVGLWTICAACIVAAKANRLL